MCGLGKIQKANFYADKDSENSGAGFFATNSRILCSLVWSERAALPRLDIDSILECSFWLSCSVFSLIVWANLDYFYTVFRLLVRVTLCIVFRTFIWNFRGFKFRLDCFFLELFGFQVWSTRQPPQTPPKRREWILHRKRRKRNVEHVVL